MQVGLCINDEDGPAANVIDLSCVQAAQDRAQPLNLVGTGDPGDRTPEDEDRPASHSCSHPVMMVNAQVGLYMNIENEPPLLGSLISTLVQ